MKWTNKGHQFDEIGERFKDVDKVYIYGAGDIGMELFDYIKALGCVEAFIDANPDKQKTGYYGKRVLAPHEFAKTNHEKCIVVIAMLDLYNSYTVKRNFLNLGFVPGVNIFEYVEFRCFYSRIFALYRFNKLITHAIVSAITEKCTLKCKYCAGLIPYVKNPSHVTFEQLKNDFDSFFDVFDYAKDVRLSGGEPFLNPSLRDLVEYLFSEHGEKFRTITVISNCFWGKNDELIQLLKNPKIIVEPTDYTQGITDEKIKEKIKSNIVMLKGEGINIKEIKYHWINMGTGKETHNWSEDKLTSFYDNCNNSTLCATNSSLAACSTGHYRSSRMGYDFVKDMSIPLLSSDPRYRHIILEYISGYTDTGYLEFCKYCNGCRHINSNILVPAEQIQEEYSCE